MPYAGNVHEATKHTPFSLMFGKKGAVDDETNWDLRLPCLMLAMFMKPLNTHHFP